MSGVISPASLLAKAYIMAVMMFRRTAGEHLDICECPHLCCQSIFLPWSEERVEMLPRGLTSSSSSTTRTFSCSLQGSSLVSVYCVLLPWCQNQSKPKRYFNKIFVMVTAFITQLDFVLYIVTKWNAVKWTLKEPFLLYSAVLPADHKHTVAPCRCMKQKLQWLKTAGKHTVLSFVFLLFSV